MGGRDRFTVPNAVGTAHRPWTFIIFREFNHLHQHLAIEENPPGPLPRLEVARQRLKRKFQVDGNAPDGPLAPASAQPVGLFCQLGSFLSYQPLCHNKTLAPLLGGLSVCALRTLRLPLDVLRLHQVRLEDVPAPCGASAVSSPDWGGNWEMP